METIKNLSQVGRWPGRDSKRTPSEYELAHAPVRSVSPGDSPLLGRAVTVSTATAREAWQRGELNQSSSNGVETNNSLLLVARVAWPTGEISYNRLRGITNALKITLSSENNVYHRTQSKVIPVKGRGGL
jgi:hypothetical protein